MGELDRFLKRQYLDWEPQSEILALFKPHEVKEISYIDHEKGIRFRIKPDRGMSKIVTLRPSPRDPQGKLFFSDFDAYLLSEGLDKLTPGILAKWSEAVASLKKAKGWSRRSLATFSRPCPNDCKRANTCVACHA